MAKNSGRFYVKTYGATHTLGGGVYKNKNGQRWMIYWRKKCIMTCSNEEDAEFICAKMNANYENEVRKIEAQVEAEKKVKMHEVSVSSLRAQVNDTGEKIKQLEKEIGSRISAVKGCLADLLKKIDLLEKRGIVR